MNTIQVRHVSIKELPPAPDFPVIVSEFEDERVSPFGVSYVIYQLCTVRSVKKYKSRILKFEYHHYVDINTTNIENTFCVSSKVHNCSIFVEGLDTALDYAKRILKAMEDPETYISST